MTSEEFAQGVVDGTMPWTIKGQLGKWSDSTKEQYFHLLNAEQANQMELDRWRLNNDYNTPRNQMIRMIEAGINPAAAYQSVDTGNSGSPANVHQSGTAAFHDTSDRLQKVNTIMNGIATIMSTIENGVQAVNGIQSYQRNMFDTGFNLARYHRYFDNGNAFYPGLWNSSSGLENPIEVAPGVYTTATHLGDFPEFFKAFGFDASRVHNSEAQTAIQTDLANRRTRIDNLIQSIFKGIDNHASSDEMLRMFLELFAYGAMSKFGGF